MAGVRQALASVKVLPHCRCFLLICRQQRAVLKAVGRGTWSCSCSLVEREGPPGEGALPAPLSEGGCEPLVSPGSQGPARMSLSGCLVNPGSPVAEPGSGAAIRGQERADNGLAHSPCLCAGEACSRRLLHWPGVPVSVWEGEGHRRKDKANTAL